MEWHINKLFRRSANTFTSWIHHEYAQRLQGSVRERLPQANDSLRAENPGFSQTTPARNRIPLAKTPRHLMLKSLDWPTGQTRIQRQ
jgi:hypothetical protein